MILRLALALLLLLCVPGLAFAQTSTVVVATDLHYISPAITDHGEYFTRMIEQSDGKMMMYSEEIMEAFVRQMVSMRPDAVILSGDLTFNGALKSHRDLTLKLRRIAESGIPLYVMPGNHDLNNRNAASFSGDSFQRIQNTSAFVFAELYEDFGFSDALSRDPASLSYTAALLPGLRLMMLDVNGNGSPGSLTDKTRLWAAQQLAAARDAGERVLFVSHQNLMPHNSLFVSGFVFPGAAEMQSLCERYGVRLALSGHMHAQHTAVSEAGLTEIATSSMVVGPCQFGVLTIDGADARYETRSVDVSGWAKENGRTEEALLRFPETSAAFFTRSTVESLTAQLGGGEKARALAEWAAAMNLDYFSGRQDRIDRQSEEAKFWSSYPSGFAVYLNSVLSEEGRNHTEWSGSL